MDREPMDWSARSPRRPTAHSATITLNDGREVRALVTNLSYEGCQLFAEAELCVGDTLGLTLPDRGSIQAQVRWTAGDKAGIKFLSDDSSEQRRARIGV
jgi:hypothetical protein